MFIGLVLPLAMAIVPFKISIYRNYHYENTQMNSGVILLVGAGALMFGRRGERAQA